jgi:hypothetical protein
MSSREQDVQAQMQALLSSLIEQTVAGNIRWSVTDQENHYLYSGSKSSVTISFHSSNYDDDAFIMALLNSRGTEVERLEQEWVKNDEGTNIPRPWNDDLHRLYELARRAAMGIDKLLAATLADIKKGYNKPSPPPKSNFDDPWAVAPPDDPPF